MPTPKHDDAATEAPARITKIIADLGDWRGDALRRIRELIHEADPDVVEDIKWVKPSNPAGVPTWSHDGTICTGEIYKAKVKLTFFHGASLDSRLFTLDDGGATRRAIDLPEGAALDAGAFKALVRAAVEHNANRAKKN